MALVSVGLNYGDQTPTQFLNRFGIASGQGGVERSGAQIKADFLKTITGGGGLHYELTAVNVTTGDVLLGPTKFGSTTGNLLIGANVPSLSDADVSGLLGFDRAEDLGGSTYYLDTQPLLTLIVNWVNALGPAHAAWITFGNGVGVPSGDYYYGYLGAQSP